MIAAPKNVLGEWTQDMKDWFQQCAEELHTVYRQMDWRWSGEPVSEDMLAVKIMELTVNVTQTIIRQHNQKSSVRSHAAISSGGIKVEGIGNENSIYFYCYIERIVGV